MSRGIMPVIALLVAGLVYVSGSSAFAEDNVLQGSWNFTTVGKQGMHGQDPKALSQSFLLTFTAKSQSRNEISGQPFGFTIAASHAPLGKLGESFSFTTPYMRGSSSYTITWRGKLSEDGKKITDGKFSMIMGSGEFTAEKK